MRRPESGQWWLKKRVAKESPIAVQVTAIKGGWVFYRLAGKTYPASLNDWPEEFDRQVDSSQVINGIYLEPKVLRISSQAECECGSKQFLVKAKDTRRPDGIEIHRLTCKKCKTKTIIGFIDDIILGADELADVTVVHNPVTLDPRELTTIRVAWTRLCNTPLSVEARKIAESLDQALVRAGILNDPVD